jgi:hypothetical protein
MCEKKRDTVSKQCKLQRLEKVEKHGQSKSRIERRKDNFD